MACRHINVLEEAFAGRFENLEVNLDPTPDLYAGSSLGLWEPQAARYLAEYERAKERRRRRALIRLVARTRARAARERRAEEAREAEEVRRVDVRREIEVLDRRLKENGKELPALQHAFDDWMGRLEIHDPNVHEGLLRHMNIAKQTTTAEVRVYDICMWFRVGVPQALREAIKMLSVHYHTKAELDFERFHCLATLDDKSFNCKLCGNNNEHMEDDDFYAAVQKTPFGFETGVVHRCDRRNSMDDYQKRFCGWQQIDHIRNALEIRKTLLLHAEKEKRRWPFAGDSDEEQYGDIKWMLSLDQQIRFFLYESNQVLRGKARDEEQMEAWLRIHRAARAALTPAQREYEDESYDQLVEATESLMKELHILDFHIKYRGFCIRQIYEHRESLKLALKSAPPADAWTNEDLEEFEAVAAELLETEEKLERESMVGVEGTPWPSYQDALEKHKDSSLEEVKACHKDSEHMECAFLREFYKNKEKEQELSEQQ